MGLFSSNAFGAPPQIGRNTRTPSPQGGGVPASPSMPTTNPKQRRSPLARAPIAPASRAPLAPQGQSMFAPAAPMRSVASPVPNPNSWMQRPDPVRTPTPSLPLPMAPAGKYNVPEWFSKLYGRDPYEWEAGEYGFDPKIVPTPAPQRPIPSLIPSAQTPQRVIPSLIPTDAERVEAARRGAYDQTVPATIQTPTTIPDVPATPTAVPVSNRAAGNVGMKELIDSLTGRGLKPRSNGWYTGSDVNSLLKALGG